LNTGQRPTKKGNHNEFDAGILEENGIDFDEAMQEAAFDSVVDACCTACGYFEERALEPDGYGQCPECYSNDDFASVLVHAGLI
jgi:hypothetical protein